MNKPMWDWMDKAEGRKDSSHENMQKERVRQGYAKEKKHALAKNITLKGGEPSESKKKV